MTWTVFVSRPADHDLEKLSHDVSARILEAVKLWADEERGDIRAVQNLDRATHRLRVGDWRVLLKLDHGTRTATVMRALSRGSAYKP